MSAAKMEVVLKNSCRILGEGPHWDDATQSLLYVDIRSREVHRWNSLTGEDNKVRLKDTVGFVVPRRAGGYVIGLGRRLSLLEWDTATATTIAEVDQDRGTRFNDGKCDPRGRIWAGTSGYEKQDNVIDPDMGSLYSLDLDRSVTKHLSGISVSNGLTWSGDNRVMYYIDSPTRKISAFDYDPTKGTISNQRVVVEFSPDSEDTYGFPDGMTIDLDDKLWVACWNAAAVYKFDPETGKTLQKVDIPAKQTTSVCWGGKNLDELYVTSARCGMSDEYVRETQPLAGSVFKVTGLGAKGRPANVYEG
ncbi:hypothetical protein BaRGS_00000456 [Batillaria attramentaria]|uniref:Regucalcin n=1 Tax=Batillaria attramentaria TaxID=370345 RepID=A0ABD0M903_9CAEN